MNTKTDMTSAGAFERLYQANGDPWNFAASAYEQHRYRMILASLRRPAYGSAFEPGCSVGELTVQLATRCATLMASDFAASAVQRARTRCAGLTHVDIVCADLTIRIPDGPFDLIVFSEIGYYFERNILANMSVALAERLNPGGEITAAHWLGDSEDHILHGDVVHEVLLDNLPLRHVEAHQYAGFRLDSWSKD